MVSLNVFGFHLLRLQVLAVDFSCEENVLRIDVAAEGVSMGDFVAIDGDHLRLTMLLFSLALLSV